MKYKVLLELYKKAKVFALPSTCEGVGIVALDAAIYGCNILLTDIPGPKEYYPEVNSFITVCPTNIDDIGNGVIKLLNTDNNKSLYNLISDNFSSDRVSLCLINMYSNDD